MKKLLITFIASAAVVVALPMFAAFEAHVVNVTATIENALSVPMEQGGIAFGTVFPQEVLEKTFDVSLSSSFIAENRVDDVDYFLRQKPKCQVTPEFLAQNPSAPQFAQVSENVDGVFVCPNGYTIMPLLCPYLSKHEITTDGQGENDGEGINSFHGLPGIWNMAAAQLYDVVGHLAKSQGDSTDTWNIDLHTPCFQGECAQDWASFVLHENADANPTAYQADPLNKGKMYGCDLWLEVKGISTCTPTPGGTFNIVSNTTDTVTETAGNAVALSFVHPGWTAGPLIGGGSAWIWATDPVLAPTTVDDTKTFNKTFNVVGPLTSASVTIATDNFYQLYINNVLVGQELVNENNFQIGNQDTYNVVANLNAGLNTIKVVATNKGLLDSTPASNPAGIRYNLTYTTSAVQCLTD